MTFACSLSALILSTLTVAPAAFAQEKVNDAVPPPSRHADNRPASTFHLSNNNSNNTGNEVLTALRLMVNADAKLYLDADQNSIVVRASPEDLALIQKLIPELDRPKKIYRLTYTVTESDSGKRIGIQHFGLVVVDGGRTTLKNGSRIPVATGTTGTSGSSSTIFTYLDIGINIDASVDDSGAGARLRTKVEDSSVAEDKSQISGVQEPIIRQSVLEGTSLIVPGKPLVLGAIDVAGSTRHLDVEVVMDPIK